MRWDGMPEKLNPLNMAKRKKTGIQCLAKFPADVQEKFIVNMVADAKKPDRVVYLLTNKYDDLLELLLISFVWHETPEGHDYWASIGAGIRA